MKFLKNLPFILIMLLFFALTSMNITAQDNTVFKDSTVITKEICTKYFDAYIKLDFDTMKTVMHEDISFQDPTAGLIFGWKKIEGKSNVYENFKKSYAAIVEMKADTTRSIFSSNTAVFELMLTWKFMSANDREIEINMPLVVVLTVKAGKVIEHRDYGDYNYFIEQYNKLKNID
jgi:ketosteroid isomerase-like protein